MQGERKKRYRNAFWVSYSRRFVHEWIPRASPSAQSGAGDQHLDEWTPKTWVNIKWYIWNRKDFLIWRININTKIYNLKASCFSNFITIQCLKSEMDVANPFVPVHPLMSHKANAKNAGSSFSSQDVDVYSVSTSFLCCQGSKQKRWNAMR